MRRDAGSRSCARGRRRIRRRWDTQAFAIAFTNGLALPKRFREAGFVTDLFDATPLATCRMYPSDRETWRGLSKDTHEGLGAPARILPGTLLLLGGQVLPFVLLCFGTRTALAAALFAVLPRIIAARRFHQPSLGVLLHPIGVLALVGIQWLGLLRFLRGVPAQWKGRRYSRTRRDLGSARL